MSPERAPINILLRGEQSGGAVSVIGSGSLPGFGGPPLHHHDFDETFYVMTVASEGGTMSHALASACRQ
ncbi:MAG TPA: hypothetical protein VKA82_11345 [Rubrobacter sp.]|nr:hypothetical protein [Rubrobacter sp.]